jgi:hypothetical protein
MTGAVDGRMGEDGDKATEDEEEDGGAEEEEGLEGGMEEARCRWALVCGSTLSSLTLLLLLCGSDEGLEDEGGRGCG